MEETKNLVTRFKNYRKKNNLSQLKVHQILKKDFKKDVSPRRISDFERYKLNPEELIRVKHILEIFLNHNENHSIETTNRKINLNQENISIGCDNNLTSNLNNDSLSISTENCKELKIYERIPNKLNEEDYLTSIYKKNLITKWNLENRSKQHQVANLLHQLNLKEQENIKLKTCVNSQNLFNQILRNELHRILKLSSKCEKRPIYYCHQCDFKTMSDVSFLIHLINENKQKGEGLLRIDQYPCLSENTYKCPICFGNFTKPLIYDHLYQFHTNEKQNICHECSIGFTMPSLLEEHILLYHKTSRI